MKLSHTNNYFLIVVIGVFYSCQAGAQEKNLFERPTFQIGGGYSKHGTGDMRGFIVNCEYNQRLKKKYGFAVAMATTVHDGQVELTYPDQNGHQVDASFRYVTAGIQLSGKFRYDLMQNPSSNFSLKIGPLLRYQTSSYYDDLSIVFPGATGWPFPVMQIINRTPQRTLAVGGILQAAYGHYISRSLFLEIAPGIQTDSNGDTIWHIMASAGIAF